MSKRRFNSRYEPNAKSVGSPHPRLLVNGYVSFKQCRHGLFMYNLNDLYVGRALDIYGEWCEAELSCLGQIINNGDVIVDVGANIGTHTVFFSKKVSPDGRVYAIEPQRGTFEFLCANLVLNGVSNVYPILGGASDLAGAVRVPALNPANKNNFGNMAIEGHADGDLVKVLPLDDLELKRCNLIKIDTEGMELKVLRGAEKTIQTCRPFIFVENNAKDGSPEMLQFLLDLNYKCWWHIAFYYDPNNFFRNSENEWENYAPEANMLCVPNELDININGFETVIGAADNFIHALTRMSLIKT